MSTNYVKQITDTAGTTHDILESVDTRIFRGTCPTAAATANKIVTLDDATNFTQTTGVRVAVTFTYGNTATTPTLQVNNNYARNIVMATSATTTTSGNGTTYNTWGPGETVIFTYYSNTWLQNGSSLSIYNTYALADSKTSNTGTVTSVGLSNATNGGLTISGSPITTSGSITVGHSNTLTSAQTTQAVYPIKIDINGHISAYGSAVTVPTITLNGSSTTSPSFYAPTGAGTANYFLKSAGSGAPAWSQPIKYGTSLPSSGDFTGQVFILTT